MKKWTVLFVLFFTSSVFALDRADEDSIQSIVASMTTAWNEHEGRGFADPYAADANFVNIFGMAFSGRDAIEDRHLQILKTFLKGSKFEVVDTKIREAKPGVVIAHVYWRVSGIQNSQKLGETIEGVFTHTFVNEDGWQIAATQNTLISS